MVGLMPLRISGYGPFRAVLGRPEPENDPRFATNTDRVQNVNELEAQIEECLAHDSVAN